MGPGSRSLGLLQRAEYSEMPSTVSVCLLPPGGNTSTGHDWMYLGSYCSSMSLNACVYGLHLDLQLQCISFILEMFINVLLLFNFIIGTFFFFFPPCIVTKFFFLLLVYIFCFLS